MSETFRKKLPIIIVLFTFLTILFLVDAFVKVRPESSHYISLDNGWNTSIRGNQYHDVALSKFSFHQVRRGDQLLFECTLPSSSIDHPVLELYTIYSAVTVKLDHKTIYTYGQSLFDHNKLMGYGYHYISLPDDYQNHTLSIALCVGENNAFTSLAPLRIYDSNYMIRDFISQQRFPLFINSFLIVFGVCLSVISLIYMSQFDRLSSILCLCLFSITIGIWSMCNLDLFFLYSYDYEAKTYLEFVCIYLAPIFFTLYFWNDIRSRSNKLLRYSYHFLLIAQIVFFVLALFLQITDICHLPRMLQLNHLLLLTLMIFILIMLIHDTRKKHVKSLFLLIGMISMILIGMIDIIRFNVMKYLPYFSNMHFTSITVWGLLIFIFSLIVDYSLQMQQGMYEIARTETLERMAYLDVLTDLYNRRKCEDLLDSLDHGTTDYGILNFDLNNLKMTNDQLGHATGDLLIQNFSALLLHTFQPFGSVGRIGGDEFIVILPDIAGIDINALLRQLHDKIMIYNESHESLRISVAHGYCASVEPEIHTARDAYKVADKRMYLQKTIMKKATLK